VFGWHFAVAPEHGYRAPSKICCVSAESASLNCVSSPRSWCTCSSNRIWSGSRKTTVGPNPMSI